MARGRDWVAVETWMRKERGSGLWKNEEGVEGG